jgi:hypothetical protein
LGFLGRRFDTCPFPVTVIRLDISGASTYIDCWTVVGPHKVHDVEKYQIR